jgi:hypothetical protein
MFRENKNLKDLQKDTIKDTSIMPAPYQAIGFGSGSYTKTNKLITALYMVTDIIDKDEPLRNKLRTLGAGIISDINYTPSSVSNKISEIMSFLDIASAVNIISEMNCNILKKEFLELNQSIKESVGEARPNMLGLASRSVDLSDFFQEELSSVRQGLAEVENKEKFKGHYIGHQYPTRIGVQKGSTLMKALSDKITPETTFPSDRRGTQGSQDFDKLKKQRRDDIINIIKTIGGNATIKDIKDRTQTLKDKIPSLVSFSEKTLQRELVSMVKDGVLNKTGEKRWSKYFLL